MTWQIATLVLVAAAACRGADEAVWPMPEWQSAPPGDVGMAAAKLRLARDYALTGRGSGIITRHGKCVMTWGDQRRRYDLKSTTKSIGVTALALAIMDGKMRLSDSARSHFRELGVPPDRNGKTGWLDEITIQHLATQTAGFGKPGGFEPLVFRPGTMWKYSDGGPNWLADCITLAYRRDIQDFMFGRVFDPLGITRKDLMWRKNAYRPHKLEGTMRREFGSGVHANVDAMARIGYLYLRGGEWQGRQLIPRSFVDMARTTVAQVVGLPEHDKQKYGNASDHYGLLWWNNADGALTNVPRDAYWSWGLHESLIVVIPSLDVVVARAGKSWQRNWAGHYSVLKPFLEPIVEACMKESVKVSSAAPYPPSPVIKGIDWEPKSEIIRKGPGSDNWPLTWADDGDMYTAYGDGWGFVPKTPQKLSLGIAKVVGSPPGLKGVNIRAATIEDVGDGKRGKKASGILMVDGTLYLWARNAGNSQLVWSGDHGKTWQWAEWKFTTSFGCPTFLNIGRNYEGARDEFVYVYSFDSETAYDPADRMVMARVPKRRIRERAAYEFVSGASDGHEPLWTRDIGQRGAVFEHPGRCYRSGITYSAGLKRYLWCQIVPGNDTRFEGGFGIYDAPEPWGLWTTVFFTQQWDVGPGETCSLPTKWMSDDGRAVHLVFSGDDHFSVRRGYLRLAE